MCIAKEGEMQAFPASSTSATFDSPERVPALQPIVPVERSGSASSERGSLDREKDSATRSEAILVGPEQRSLSIQYALDDVANIWVAQVLDSESGEVVRTVPSTRLLHQLAEVGHDGPHVDARA